MKKIIALLLCAAMSLSIIACGQTGSTGNSEPNKNTEAGQNTENNAGTEKDVVKEAAMAYFANFADNKNMISATDLFAKINANEEILIIDIRSADDYAKGHLKGAVNIPYATIGDNLEIIPNDIPIYVNCYSGQTSSQAVALLNCAGKFATNITGGFSKISATEGFDAVSETEAHVLSDSYPVDDKIEAAIKAYFTAASTNASFNYKPDKALEAVEAGTYTVVDVRAADAYNAGHIEGAINIPFGKGMQESFSQIPTDKPVLVCCYSGQTASQVMGILRLLGYETYNVLGGMGAEGGSGWVGAGNPVVK